MKMVYTFLMSVFLFQNVDLQAEYNNTRGTQVRRRIGSVVIIAAVVSAGVWGAFKLYKAFNPYDKNEDESKIGEKGGRGKSLYPKTSILPSSEIARAQKIFEGKLTLSVEIPEDGESITLHTVQDEEHEGKGITLHESVALLDTINVDTQLLIFDIPYTGTVQNVSSYLADLGTSYPEITSKISHIIVATHDLHNTTLSKMPTLETKTHFNEEVKISVCSYADAKRHFVKASDSIVGKHKMLIFIKAPNHSDL